MSATTLMGRVRSLEQAQGDCGLCHGEGYLVVEYSDPDMAALHAAGPGRSESEGCPLCGRKQLQRVAYVKETMIRQ